MDYQGIPGTNPTPTGVIFVPEGIPHGYEAQPDGTNILKVYAVGYDSNGNIPTDDPAPENQGANFHRSTFNPKDTSAPDWIRWKSAPTFAPGYETDPRGNPGARWIASLDANGDPVYGVPPASSGSVQAQAAALAVAAAELSQRVAAGK